MHIGLFHGYELTGSGSNEYNKYLAKALYQDDHHVHIICREEEGRKIPFITDIISWDTQGIINCEQIKPESSNRCYLHLLPKANVYPVYVTDKKRKGNVKAFTDLSDEELKNYHNFYITILQNILTRFPLDILHANHLVYQPVIAMEACKKTKTPFVIFPHGSSIEYTIRQDRRFFNLAKQAILSCDGLIIGNREVRDRIISLYPEIKDLILSKTHIVGVGVDTSLFQPIEKNKREDVIKKLIHLLRTKDKGKSQKQTQQLLKSVQDKGVLAINSFKKKYPLDFPDQDIEKKLLSIPWNEKILLFVGALTPGKGLQSLIFAFPQILKKHPLTHLIIIGSGDYREVLETLVFAISSKNKTLIKNLCDHAHFLAKSHSSHLWDDIKSYLNTHSLDNLLKNAKNIESHIHFLGRFDHKLLSFIFPCADVAIFPSVIPEAYPLVLMESLANGVWPVVSYFSGFKDGIDELENFLDKKYVDQLKIPIDPQVRINTLSKKISNILHIADKNNKSFLRKIAEENYDWKLRSKQMVKAYQSILSKTSSIPS